MKCYVNICAILGFVVGSICTAPDSLNFYSLAAKDIQGNEISLEQYKGMVSHVFNILYKYGYVVACSLSHP